MCIIVFIVVFVFIFNIFKQLFNKRDTAMEETKATPLRIDVAAE